MEDYKVKAEAQLLAMKKQEEESNRQMLRMEAVIGYTCSIAFLVLIFAASYAVTSTPWRIGMIALGAVLFVVGIYYCLRIEREAGYYECKKCGYRYVPTMSQVTFAPHIGRSRRMTCPHCGQKSYHKKVLTKEMGEE